MSKAIPLAALSAIVSFVWLVLHGVFELGTARVPLGIAIAWLPLVAVNAAIGGIAARPYGHKWPEVLGLVLALGACLWTAAILLLGAMAPFTTC